MKGRGEAGVGGWGEGGRGVRVMKKALYNDNKHMDKNKMALS